MSEKPIQHGTSGAYKHCRLQPGGACQPCLDARAAYMRDYHAKRRKPRELAPCGTETAYRRHLKRGEPTCEPCRAAHASVRSSERQKESA